VIDDAPKVRPIAKSFLPHQMDIAGGGGTGIMRGVKPRKARPVANIRTVLTTISPLFSDILEQLIGGHVDLDIVAKTDTRDRLEERLRAIGPDLVLIGLYHGEADEIAHSLLAAAPLAKVIAFSTDGRHAYVYERHAHRTALIDFTPDGLVKAISGI
jgi:DNA-binding NarL/FixJ family response regulator